MPGFFVKRAFVNLSRHLRFLNRRKLGKETGHFRESGRQGRGKQRLGGRGKKYAFPESFWNRASDWCGVFSLLCCLIIGCQFHRGCLWKKFIKGEIYKFFFPLFVEISEAERIRRCSHLEAFPGGWVLGFARPSLSPSSLSLGTLSKPRRRRQRGHGKTIDLISKTIAQHARLKILYIS